MLEHTAKPPARPTAVTVIQTDTGIGSVLSDHLDAAGVDLHRVDAADLAVGDEAAADARLAAAMAGCQAVVLAANLPIEAPHRMDGYMANLRVAASVVRQVEPAGVGHIVYLSSEAVYPPDVDHVNEASCAAASDLVGGMHRAREVMLQSLHKVPVAVLRPAQVYGLPGEDRPGPDRMLRWAASGEELRMPGGGEDRLDYVLVDDVCRVVDETLSHASRGVLNIATGHSIDLATVARKIAAVMQGEQRVHSVPRARPITHRDFDITAVFKAFPKLALLPLDQGLSRVAERMSQTVGGS